jgi:hypothetical protein
VPVGPDVVSMAQCDAQHVSLMAGPSPGSNSAPANDLEPDQDDDEHRHEPVDTSGAATAPAPATTSGAHVSADGLPRAKQSTPPALRRAVLLRDQHRCQVPGCSNARWVDVHHIELRSEGGCHLLQNLVCLCGAHHRAAHHGQITLERSEAGAIRVRHADGTEYGGNVHPQQLELRAKVFSALRQLGFREGQVRAALEQLASEPEVAQASFDGVLRAALARLRPRGTQR